MTDEGLTPSMKDIKATGQRPGQGQMIRLRDVAAGTEWSQIENLTFPLNSDEIDRWFPAQQTSHDLAVEVLVTGGRKHHSLPTVAPSNVDEFPEGRITFQSFSTSAPSTDVAWPTLAKS
jgi:hypothetical protein